MKLLSFPNISTTDGSWIQYLTTVAGTLFAISAGMHLGWPTPFLPKLEHSQTFKMTHNDGSWIATMPYIGSIIGTIISSIVVDVIGRKKVILLTCIPFVVSWIMIAVVDSLSLLYVARFIAGIAEGASLPTVVMHNGEISSPKRRGFLGCMLSVSLILGYLLINIIGSYLSISVSAWISLTFPVLALMTFMWMPESPYLLVMKAKYEEARKNLQVLRGDDNIDEEMTRIEDAVKAQMENTRKFLDLFTVKSNRRALYAMMIGMTAYSACGNAPVTFYSQSIFREGGSDVSSEVAFVIYFSTNLVIMLVSSYMIDTFGRRPLLIFSLSGAAASLFCESIYFFLKTKTDVDVASVSGISVVLLISYIIFLSAGVLQVPVVLLGELVPSNVKAAAICLANVYFCVMGVVMTKIFQVLVDAYTIFMPLFVFALCYLICIVLTLTFIPETKGKNLEEIQVLFGGKIRRESQN